MKKKKLLIISTSFNYYDTRFNSDIYDILSIPISHQYFLNNRNIRFLTLEKFYNKNFEQILTNVFHKDLREWLGKIDEELVSINKISHSFSGNGFWFTHRLTELFYIQNIVNALSIEYENIELITDTKVNFILQNNIKIHGPNFDEVFGNTDLRIERLIYYALPNINIKIIKSKIEFKEFKLYFDYYSTWLLHGIDKKLKSIFNYFIHLFYKKDKLFLSLQDGYDLDILKNYLKNIEFKNIKNEILQNIDNNKNEKSLKINEKVIKISSIFFKKYFPSYRLLLEGLISSYNNDILNKIKDMNLVIENKLNNKNLNGLILPMCSQDIFDFIIVKIANKKNIPVFFMKHNGVIESFKATDFYIEYLEQNRLLKRIQFVHSKYEYEKIKSIKNINAKVISPISALDNKMEKYIQKNNNKKKLLMAFGSPSNYTLKDVGAITFDLEKIYFLEKIISICLEANLELHVKLHPRGKKELINLFVQILSKNWPTKKIKIIFHKKIEKLFDQYDAIIVDTPFSSVVSNAIYTNKNIIIYCPRKECINIERYELLKKRVFLIHGLYQLNDIFKKLIKCNFKYNHDNEIKENIVGEMSYSEAIQSFERTLNSNKI